MNTKHWLLALTILFCNNNFAHVSESEFNELKQQVQLLQKQLSAVKKINKSSTTLALNEYVKTATTCTELTNQPANACSDASSTYCYSAASFIDADDNSLIGYTFTATKTTADYTNMDGGVWLCDNQNIRIPLINQCTKIGGNAHTRAADAVEFTIPAGTITTPVIIAAYKNQFGGINGSSKLTDFAICKQAGVAAINE